MRNAIDNVRVNNAYSYRNNVHFESDKHPILKDHVRNSVLQKRSFLKKFMNFAEGSFNKFHMKWPLSCKIFSFYLKIPYLICYKMGGYPSKTTKICIITVELQWLEHLWDHEN